MFDPAPLPAAPTRSVRGALSLVPPHQIFTVDVDRRDRIVFLTGELDIATAGIMIDAVADLTYQALEPVTLDFGEVTFIDSCGLGAVVEVRNALTQLDLELTLQGVAIKVRRVFALGGLICLLQ